MRKLIIPVILGLIVIVSSCKDETSYMPQITQMKDSIFKAYPTTVASIWMNVLDKTDLKIVLGGKRLYATQDAEKQKMAADMGTMAWRIFGKDSYLKKGTLVFTKDEQNTVDTPADAVTVPINMDAAKNIVYPAK